MEFKENAELKPFTLSALRTATRQHAFTVHKPTIDKVTFSNKRSDEYVHYLHSVITAKELIAEWYAEDKAQ